MSESSFPEYILLRESTRRGKVSHLSLTLLFLEWNDGAEHEKKQLVAATFQTVESYFSRRRER